MSRITAKTFRPRHLRAACALLNLDAEGMADKLGLDVNNVLAFDRGDPVSDQLRTTLFDALIDHGVKMRGGSRPSVSVPDPDVWLIDLRRKSCPRCGMALPKVRIPKTLSQLMWGGWTCRQCGAELKKSGEIE